MYEELIKKLERGRELVKELNRLKKDGMMEEYSLIESELDDIMADASEKIAMISDDDLDLKKVYILDLYASINTFRDVSEVL